MLWLLLRQTWQFPKTYTYVITPRCACPGSREKLGTDSSVENTHKIETVPICFFQQKGYTQCTATQLFAVQS